MIVGCIYMVESVLLHVYLIYVIILLQDFSIENIVFNSIIVDKCLQVFVAIFNK